MGAMRAQVILHTVDNVPANYVTNSWAFMGADPSLDATAITTALATFYGTFAGLYYSPAIAQNGHEVKFYDLPGTPPNYPVTERTFNLGSATSGTQLPSELSVVLSIQAPRTPGFPQARRRGRLYLGPFNSTANSNGRPLTALMTSIANASQTFKTTIDGLASDTQWAVWSVADQAAVAITNGWIDNAWDVQRRRGVEDTQRTVWN